jgi:hypothetical protein
LRRGLAGLDPDLGPEAGEEDAIEHVLRKHLHRELTPFALAHRGQLGLATRAHRLGEQAQVADRRHRAR